MVAHAFNLSTQGAEARESLSLRRAWSIEFQDSQGYREKASGGGGEEEEKSEKQRYSSNFNKDILGQQN
jgi:hypothetical protein